MLDVHPARDKHQWLHTCYAILDELALSGNLIAQSQKSEIQQLERMFCEWEESHTNFHNNSTSFFSHLRLNTYPPTAESDIPTASTAQQAPLYTTAAVGTPISDLFGNNAYLDDVVFNGAQILDLANSIDSGDAADWMSQALADSELW